MSNVTEQRKLAAIMFTDMVGYSALSQRDDKLAQVLLEEHRQLLRGIFPRGAMKRSSIRERSTLILGDCVINSAKRLTRLKLFVALATGYWGTLKACVSEGYGRCRISNCV